MSAASRIAPRPSSGPSALIATGDIWLCQALVGAFRAEGFVPVAVDDGYGAWAAFHDRRGALDLLVAATALPGLDGAELARRLRIDRPELAVLLLDPDPSPGAWYAFRVRGLRTARLPLPLAEVVRRARSELFRRRRVRSWGAPAPYAVA